MVPDPERLLPLIPCWVVASLAIVLPGAACAEWFLPRGLPWSGRVASWLALSVPLGGAAIALLAIAGLSLSVATGVLLAASALLVAAAFARRRPHPERSGRAAVFVTLAFVAVTAAFPLASEWWRLYSDNWVHVAIVRAVARGVPPLDPGFAGAPLQYAWIYHAFVAGVHVLTGADIYALMLVLSAVALAATLLAAAAVLPRRASVWSLVLLGLGLNALFPLFLPLVAARALTGEVRGMAELVRQFDLRPLQWETTGVFLRGLSGQDFFLDKFMVVTPFALSLAAFTAWIGSLRRWLAGGGSGELALGAAFALGAGLMHPVTGIFIAASCGLGAVLAILTGVAGRRRVAAWGAATLLGIVPVVLYTRSVIGGAGGSHSELPFDLAPLKLLGYFTCLALGLLFAVRPLVHAWREGGAARAFCAWMLAAGAVALVGRLPGPSPFFTIDKLAYLVWIPLVIAAGPAFAGFMEARRPAVRVVLAILLFVPVNGLALASRVADPHNAARMPFDLPGFQYLRESTPRDAVLLVQLGDWESSGLAERDQYFSYGHPAAQLGYGRDEIAARADLEHRLFTTGRLTDADRARLRALGRPVYIVWADFRDPMWRWTLGVLARLQAPAGAKPPFDPAFPVRFTSRELEVREVPLTGN
jgi:hypothetical protein